MAVNLATSVMAGPKNGRRASCWITAYMRSIRSFHFFEHVSKKKTVIFEPWICLWSRQCNCNYYVRQPGIFFLSNSFTKLLEYRNHVFFLKYGSDHITPARRSSITLLPTEGGLHFAKWFFVSSFLLIPFKNVNSPMLDDPNVSCPLLGPWSNLLGWLQSLRANPMFTVLCKGYLINKVVFNPIAWVQIPSLIPTADPSQTSQLPCALSFLAYINNGNDGAHLMRQWGPTELIHSAASAGASAISIRTASCKLLLHQAWSVMWDGLPWEAG